MERLVRDFPEGRLVIERVEQPSEVLPPSMRAWATRRLFDSESPCPWCRTPRKDPAASRGPSDEGPGRSTHALAAGWRIAPGLLAQLLRRIAQALEGLAAPRSRSRH